jgi:hypothetical protein
MARPTVVSVPSGAILSVKAFRSLAMRGSTGTNSALTWTVWDPSGNILVVVRWVKVVSVSTPQMSRMNSSKKVSSITSRSTVGPPPPPAVACGSGCGQQGHGHYGEKLAVDAWSGCLV